tara:strand:+ start:5925 stop:6221 length:297 start_codon:yes stop_codon:yes gene_type:complete
MSDKITKDDLIKAFDLTAFHREQIQGFYYQNKETGEDHHVARDLLCAPEHQVFWERFDEDSGTKYDMLFDAKMEAIRERQMQLVANELNSILQNRRIL